MKKILNRTRICLLLALCWVLLAIAGYATAAQAETTAGAAPPIDLTQLIQAVIAVLCALITGRLVPWIKANTAQKQQAMLQAATDTAVYAAQQLYKTSVIQDRLEYATRWLEGRGFTADRGMIEASVRKMDTMWPTVIEATDDIPGEVGAHADA